MLQFLLCISSTMLFFLFVFSFSLSSAHSFHDDQQSLLAFKNDITQDPHGSMANWNTTVPFCNWTAVTCSRRHPRNNTVVSLNLTSMGLGGSISPSLGNLSFLHTLDLSGNALHGHIPRQLGRLFHLKTLWLYNNQLDGNIPSDLCNCTNLAYLVLSCNNLTGSIPRELGRLLHLKRLRLDSNQLKGSIPSDLSNCTNLAHMGLSYNSLTGNIPRELGSLTHLQHLILSGNLLTGNIPIFLSNISTLTELGISKNKFTGSIPHELCLLSGLQSLYLFQNELSGTIPSSLSNLSTLISLDLSINKLTGNIPLELGLLTSLQILYLNQNELSGIYPSFLSNFVNLSELVLWGNQFSGNIPNSIGNCSKLRVLGLGHNKFTGSVPVELGKLSLLEILYLNSNQLGSGTTTTMSFLVALTNCSRLKEIHLDDNKLSGVLPPAISKLSTNLSYLTLASNMIDGNIPPHIGNLSGLTYLNLSRNLFNGSIPSLRNLQQLERLDLGNNKLEGNIPNDFEQSQRFGLLDISRNMLSGKIPNSLGSLKQLRDLILHHNQLSGSIPSNLGNCINMELLDLSHNKLTGSIPHEIVELYNLHFYLNLSCNLLEGSLPMQIGKIAMAQAIDISANYLTGVIPSTLGNCVELFSLNLSRNFFQGSIPDSLENLQSLMSLDLSSNSLSGTIPITLNKLKMLQYLNLSFNKLTGEIPKGGFSTNQSIVMSLNGNTDLCGPQVFQLSACPTLRGHSTIVKRVILPVSGAIALILCCMLLRLLWRGNMHIQNIDFSKAIFQKLEHRRISYQELHTATNGFAEANLLGTGSFGSVYKGILGDGTLVAVKVLLQQNDHGEKSFNTECNISQNIQHRNLVKIITSCSNIDFKGLVFELMSNGSLEKHLYPNGQDVCELGLKTRLDIAIDVAHAMKYLHHDSSMQVVHCDIKPNNVLLDEDMLAHVNDFGNARIIGESSTTLPNSTLALRGSMGYIAPEYGLGETVSTQGDVYSYGILLLEILTRKQPTSGMFIGDLNLHNWVNSAFPNKVREVIDTSLFSEMDGDEFKETNVYKCLVSLLCVGLVCSKHSPEERPTMKVVVAVLESIREDLTANSITSRRLRRSISNLIRNSNATSNDALTTSNDQSSTF